MKGWSGGCHLIWGYKTQVVWAAGVPFHPCTKGILPHQHFRVPLTGRPSKVTHAVWLNWWTVLTATTTYYCWTARGITGIHNIQVHLKVGARYSNDSETRPNVSRWSEEGPWLRQPSWKLEWWQGNWLAISSSASPTATRFLSRKKFPSWDKENL